MIVTHWNITAAFYLGGVLRCVRRTVEARTERAAEQLASDALAMAGADVLCLQAAPS